MPEVVNRRGNQCPGIFNGKFHAFCPGGNENGIHSQLAGSGGADGVADNQFIAFLPQSGNLAGDIFHFVKCDDFCIQLQKIAEDSGTVGNTWVAGDGKILGIIFGHFDGTDDIVYRYGNINNGQIHRLSNEFGGTAPGNDHIKMMRHHGLGDERAVFHVTDFHSGINIFSLLHYLVDGFHQSGIGRYE